MTDGAARAVAEPTAGAERAPAVRWQYTVVNLGMFFAGDRLVQTLGRLGAEGWELITIYDKSSNWLANMEKGFALFKRPVPAGAAPDGPWAAALAAGAAVTGTQVRVLLDRAGITAPGAADALAAHLDDLAGLARCSVDGADGVFALGARTAAVWQPDAGVQPLQLVDLAGYRLDADRIVAHVAGGPPIELRPRPQIRDAFAALLADRGVPAT